MRNAGILKRSIGLVFIFGFLFLLRPFGAKAENVIYSTGFESTNSGYTFDGNANWEWGSPSNVGPSVCNSGSKCWGTDMDAIVPGGREGSLYSPAIAIPSLSAGQRAHVTFYLYADVNTMTARGEFYTSSNGTSWTSKAQFLETMAGGWQHYEFDVSSYAGGNLYLKWRLYLPASYGNVPGIYLDDVAVTIYDSAGTPPVFTLEAWEDPSATASCPWVYPYNGSEYVQDNDIYSVARGADKEQRDSYLLQKPLVKDSDGKYKLEIKEVDSEDSYTDFVQLKAVDHATDVQIAPDANGNVFAYKPSELIPPVSATAGGNNVLDQIKDKDNSGYQAYSGDYVDVDFGAPDTSLGARLLLRVKGFNWGTGVEQPYTGEPAVVVKVQDKDGNWNEIGRLSPRFEWSEGMFDLSPVWPDAQGQHTVRLYSVSHSIKYHEIDYVALSAGAEPTKAIVDLNLQSAEKAGVDVKDRLTTADNNYAVMSTGDKISLVFDDAAQTLPGRDFIFVSEGYYVPKSDTFFIYTHDGSNWVLRDGASYGGTDSTKTFDLSGYLPDPQGQYKIRVWQDYKYEQAGIDYVALNEGATTGTLATSTDLRYNSSILTLVQNSDNSRITFTSGQRNRWTEYYFTGFSTNTPPSVTTSVTGNQIGWTYTDTDATTTPTTVQVEVQVWTGPKGTGENEWNANLTIDPSAPIDYGGDSLNVGGTYYARLKAYDGAAWGGWNESSFTASTSTPKVTLSAATYATTTASIGGNITVTGNEDPNVTIYWGTTDGGTATSSWANSFDLGTKGIAAFTKSLTSLTPGTRYYFSAKATNSAGTSWPAASLNFQTTSSGYRLENVPNNVSTLLEGTGDDVSDDSENYQSGTQTVVVKFGSANLALVTVNFSANRDWSGFAGENDATNHTAFINLSGVQGLTGTHTLYIPGTSASNAVRVCPSATSLADVTDTCPGGYTLLNGGSNGSVTANYSNGFWIIAGLTGSGGKEITSTGGGGTFYTTISQVTVASTTATTAVISWNTDVSASSEVVYGTSTAYGLIKSDAATTTSHSILLDNLLPNTTYQFQVKSYYAGAMSFTANNTFTTLALTAGNVPTASPSGTLSFPTSPIPDSTFGLDATLRLINDNGTFYLIKNGQRYGITSPGILYSYGFEFSDGNIPSPADLALPMGSLLLPGNGYLVKTSDDKTVYLISNNQKHGFVSDTVFLALGYSFQHVLIVTNPELQTIALSDNITDPAGAHLPGVDLIKDGIVYYLGTDNQLHPYTSTEIYNSWHRDNNYSQVIPANTADLLLPIGIPLEMRVMQ